MQKLKRVICSICTRKLYNKDMELRVINDKSKLCCKDKKDCLFACFMRDLRLLI